MSMMAKLNENIQNFGFVYKKGKLILTYISRKEGGVESKRMGIVR